MELLGTTAYKKLKIIFYLFLVTMAVYFINTLFMFYINGKLVDYLPASLDEIHIPQQKPDQIHLHLWIDKHWHAAQLCAFDGCL